MFVYGRPVRGNEFLGRKIELGTVFRRLENGESTAVVGDPHIGKTSFLLQVLDPLIWTKFVGDGDPKYIYSYLDLLPISLAYTPKDFWEDALVPLHENSLNDEILNKYLFAQKENFSYRSLEKLFQSLDRNGNRFILLLDEFDRILRHGNFQDPSFFGALRSLSTHVGGVSYVMASRLTVSDLDNLGRNILDIGSPFFNNVIQLSLHPFEEYEFLSLLDRAVDKFTLTEKKYIRRVAGKHPFLLQALAATIYAERDKNLVALSEVYYDQIAHHFDDVWYGMDDNTRTVAVILSLVELGGRALGSEFSFGEIEKIESFGPELKKLAVKGLAERVSVGWQFDLGNFLLWRGEKWTSGSQAFTWWIRDVIINKSRSVPSYDEWLINKRYRVLLTQEMWEKIINTVQRIPDWASKGIGFLAKSLLDQLIQNDKAAK